MMMKVEVVMKMMTTMLMLLIMMINKQLEQHGIDRRRVILPGESVTVS